MVDDDIDEDVIETESEGAAMAVVRKRPAGRDDVPSVVVFHDGPGIRGATHEFAVDLAREGFEVLVPDLYHRHGRMLGWEWNERQADPSIVDRLRELMGTLTDGGIQADLDATLTVAGSGVGERLATVGFCLGARAVFRSMMRLPDRFAAGAMWHPSFLVDDQSDSPHLTADQLRGPLFIGIGDADRMQPLSSHRLFLDAVRQVDAIEVAVYPGADHGYTWRGEPNHHEEATSSSFDSTVALFRRALGPG